MTRTQLRGQRQGLTGLTPILTDVPLWARHYQTALRAAEKSFVNESVPEADFSVIRVLKTATQPPATSTLIGQQPAPRGSARTKITALGRLSWRLAFSQQCSTFHYVRALSFGCNAIAHSTDCSTVWTSLSHAQETKNFVSLTVSQRLLHGSGYL